MELLHLLQSEQIKTKNSLALIAAILAPLFVNFLMIMHGYLHTTPIVPLKNPWHQYISEGYVTWLELMSPLIIALIAAFYITIENKASGYKKLYSLPIPRFTILLAKTITMWSMMFISYTVFSITLLVSGYILSVIRPEYHFVTTIPDLPYLMLITLVPFFASLFVITLQFFIAYFSKKFVLTLVIGVSSVIFTLLSIFAPVLGKFSPWILTIKIINLLPIENGFKLPASFGLPANLIIPLAFLGTLCIITLGKYIIEKHDID